jgi:acyl-CoA synthetase (AMP-forming)/AMP-acid ligase II
MSELHRLIEAHAENSPEQLALTGSGGDVTYAELRAASWKVANALLSGGFGKGTRFAIFTPNCSPAVVAQIGALRAGAVWCYVNLRNTIADNIDILSRGECEVLFFHSSVAAEARALQADVASLRLAICLDTTLGDLPSLTDWMSNAPDEEPEVAINDDVDIGFQGNTGGTTGLPKLTQSTFAILGRGAGAFVDLLAVQGDARNLAVAPITHAGGIVLMGSLAAGATNVMMATATPAAIAESLERDRITTVFLPPTLVYVLLTLPGIRDRDFSALRYLMVAGAPMAPVKIVEAVELFGPVMCQGFGQTESGFPLTFITPEETAEAVSDEALRGRLASCGRVTPLLDQLAIIDRDGQECPAGELGELVVQGSGVMKHYLGDPLATAEVQVGGWHHTGDIGHLDDDGFLYISDRKRDLIISGGFNVFPYEVEQALLSHPQVQECAVVGIPHAKWGEQVTGVVELVPGGHLEPEELISHARKIVGSMKAPKEIFMMESLPRSAVGKVLKREIRASLTEDER